MARRNDAGWRSQVLAVYGNACANCGDRHVEIDHVKPRSQGGPSLWFNGLPLCGPYSKMSPFVNGCHTAKTAGQLRFRKEWFAEEALAWLADVGWVTWDRDGLPVGRGWRHFEEWRLDDGRTR